MDITLIFKVAGIGILVTVANMLLDKAERNAWGKFITLAGVIVVLGLVLTEINDLFNTVRTMFQLY